MYVLIRFLPSVFLTGISRGGLCIVSAAMTVQLGAETKTGMQCSPSQNR